MPRYNQPEFFVQDNWRLNRKFTLDLGVRFSHIGVVARADRDIGWFDPNAWDPAKAVQLWQPLCANGVFPVHRRESRRPQSADAANSDPVPGSARSSPDRATSTTAPSSARNCPTRSPVRVSRPRRVSGSPGTSSGTARPRSAAGSARATTGSATASTAGSPGSSAGR